MCVPLWAIIVAEWTAETIGGGIYLYVNEQTSDPEATTDFALAFLTARICELLFTFCLVVYDRRLFSQDERLDREFQPWLWLKSCVALLIPAITWLGVAMVSLQGIPIIMWISTGFFMIKMYACMIICGRKGTLWVDEAWDDSHTIDYAWTYCRSRPSVGLREWMHQRNPCCHPRRHTIYGIANFELRERYQISSEIWNTYLDIISIVQQLRE